MDLEDILAGPFLEPPTGEEAENPMRAHSVIVNFLYGLKSDDPFYELVELLMEKLADNEHGYYDGHEMEMFGRDGTLYMYGPNAEVLFKEVEPILDATPFLRGAVAVLRFGYSNEDAPEIEVDL